MGLAVKLKSFARITGDNFLNAHYKVSPSAIFASEFVYDLNVNVL